MSIKQILFKPRWQNKDPDVRAAAVASGDVEKAVSLGAPPEGLESVLEYVRQRVNPDQD